MLSWRVAEPARFGEYFEIGGEEAMAWPDGDTGTPSAFAASF